MGLQPQQQYILQQTHLRGQSLSPQAPLSPVSVGSNDSLLQQQAAMQMQMIPQQQISMLGLPPQFQLQLPNRQQEQEEHFARVSHRKLHGSPLSPGSTNLNASGAGSPTFGSDGSDDGLKSSVTSSKSGVVGRPQKPWITPALIDVIGAKKNNYKQYASNPTDPDAKKQHVEARKAAMKAVRKAKREYMRKQGMMEYQDKSGSTKGLKINTDDECGNPDVASPEGLTSSTASLASHFSAFGATLSTPSLTESPAAEDKKLATDIAEIQDKILSMISVLRTDSPCPPLNDEEEEEDDEPAALIEDEEVDDFELTQ